MLQEDVDRASLPLQPDEDEEPSPPNPASLPYITGLSVPLAVPEG